MQTRNRTTEGYQCGRKIRPKSSITMHHRCRDGSESGLNRPVFAGGSLSWVAWPSPALPASVVALLDLCRHHATDVLEELASRRDKTAPRDPGRLDPAPAATTLLRHLIVGRFLNIGSALSIIGDCSSPAMSASGGPLGRAAEAVVASIGTAQNGSAGDLTLLERGAHRPTWDPKNEYLAANSTAALE